MARSDQGRHPRPRHPLHTRARVRVDHIPVRTAQIALRDREEREPAEAVRRPVSGRPATRGDIDKLERSSFDALTQGGAITDDAYIVRNLTAKVWCGPAERAGATICIAPMRTAPDNDGSQP
ncbi:RusA family crossover junction endodeoxyribonuclease [Propionibacteriaceae bacterium Y2011]